MKINDDIQRVKREVEAEFFGEEQNWNRVENSVSKPYRTLKAVENIMCNICVLCTHLFLLKGGYIYRVTYILMQLQKQPNQPAIRQSEPDNRDWRSRPEQLPSPVEERFRQDQPNSHYGRGQFSSQQGVNNHFSEISRIYIWVYLNAVNNYLHKQHAHFFCT